MDSHRQITLPPTSDNTPATAPPAANQFRYARESAGEPRASSLSIGDIYYCLFRHKWKILLFAAMGLIAAFAVHQFWPVYYISQAKLLIRYLQEYTSPTDVGDAANITSTDVRGETIINSELQILTSRDLAERTAAALGPDRLRPEPDVEMTATSAAGIIAGGLTAEAPKGSRVVAITFRHEDPAIVQPVLDELIREYLRKHLEIHQTVGLYDFLAEETDQLRARLTQTEKELQTLMDQAGMLSVAEVKKAYADQMATFRQEIYAAEAQLAERKANLAELSVKDTEMEERLNVASEYRRSRGLLEKLYQREQLLLVDFTPENVMVSRLRAQITTNEEHLRELEREHPWLIFQTAIGRSPTETPSGFALDPISEATEIRNLETKIRILSEQLEKILEEASRLGTLELAITDLQRRKDLQESHYRYFFERLEQSRINEALGAGRVSNISIVQNPSPPKQDVGKRDKVAAVLLLGGLFGGIAFAFFIERYLDQSVKRPIDVEMRLGLPLFITVPLVRNLRSHRSARALSNANHDTGSAPNGANGTANGASIEHVWAELAPWALNSNMRSFFAALRDRLIYYFDVRHLVHNPKLVAVTSCGEKSGVSTIAAGLAASLSETGDGNVLLVDLNPGPRRPYQFQNGELTCDLSHALELDTRADARVKDRLYIASRASDSDDSSGTPKLIANLMPKCKSSDYDYIIFDLPPVDRISTTPHLARYMDLLLLVVESEKSKRDVVSRAADLLSEFQGNFGVVLNKTRDYTPARLRHDL